MLENFYCSAGRDELAHMGISPKKLYLSKCTLINNKASSAATNQYRLPGTVQVVCTFFGNKDTVVVILLQRQRVVENRCSKTRFSRLYRCFGIELILSSFTGTKIY